jgi:N-acetylmuramic acid 6-phosphate etherase
MRDAHVADTTESRNPATLNIDTVSTREMVALINAEDHKVADAVERALPQIAEAIDRIAARMKPQEGGARDCVGDRDCVGAPEGRLIYVGAGTSGRLGVLDASECPPTFNTPADRVVGRIAGGPSAITQAIEGAEDDREAGAQEIADLDVSEADAVVGITSSGSTPYVLGAMDAARRRGALVIGLTCNAPAPIDAYGDLTIAVVVGPEALTGSTRMKAGTAQKMVLNMLSTGVMIRLGKTYSNLMVDVRATNAKLRRRAQRIVAQACDISENAAAEALAHCDQEVKTAIVAVLNGVDPALARRQLARHHGVVRAALEVSHG